MKVKEEITVSFDSQEESFLSEIADFCFVHSCDECPFEDKVCNKISGDINLGEFCNALIDVGTALDEDKA